MPFALDFQLAECLLDGLSLNRPRITGTDLRYNDTGDRYLAQVWLDGDNHSRGIEHSSSLGFYEAAEGVARRVLWMMEGVDGD